MSRNDSISRRRVRRLAAPGLAAGVALSLSLPAMADTLGGVTSTAGTATSDPVGTATSATSTVTSAPTTVTSSVTSAPTTASSTVTTVAQAVTSAPTTVTNTVSSVTSQPAPDPVSSVTNTVTQVTSTAGNLVSGSSSKLPTNTGSKLPTSLLPTSTASAPAGLPTQQVCGVLDGPLGTLSSTVGQLPAPLGGTASGLISQVAGTLGCTPGGGLSTAPVCSLLSTVQGVLGQLPLGSLPVDVSGTVNTLLNQVGGVLGCTTGTASVSAATPVSAGDPPAAAMAPSFIPTAAANFAG